MLIRASGTLVPVVVAMLAAVGPWSVACAQSLGLDRAVELARTRSQAVAAQVAMASAAKEMAVSAGQFPDPMLTLGLNNVPVNGPDRYSFTDDFMTMRSIGLKQEFTHGAKREARTARFEREAESAEAGRQLESAALSLDAALAWLNRHESESIGALLRRLRSEADLSIDAAEAAYRGDRGSQSEVIAARAAAVIIDDRIAQNERELDARIALLARWVGPGPASDPLGPMPSIEAAPWSRHELDRLAALHPAVAVLAKQEAVAQAEAEVARSAKESDWTVELMYSQRGPSYSNMVSLVVSVPLQWDRPRRQDRDIAARLAMVEQARARREEMQREREAEMRVLWREWTSGLDRLLRYDRTLLPLLAERGRASSAAYRGGRGSLVAVFESRRAEIDAAIDRARIEAETARAWARLRYAFPDELVTDFARD